MDIFISHNWRNKTFADKLARDLEGTATVWIDHQQTKPGEEIGADIREGLSKSDLVVLVWSQYAQASQWVGQEIDFALRSGISIVPCLLDKTPLPDPLKNTLAIPFEDYNQGFGRLNLVLLKSTAAELGLDMSGLTAKLDDWDGVIDYLNNYRQQNEVTGDAAYWIERMLAVSNAAKAGGDAFLKEQEGTVAYVQSLTDRIGAAQDDPNQLREILYEVIRNEQQSPQMLGQIRVTLEQMLATFPAKAQAAEQAIPASSEQQPQEARATAPANDSNDPRQQLRHQLKGRVPDQDVETVSEILYYYNESATNVLDTLATVVQARSSAAGAAVVQDLLAYLQNPDDLLPENKYGYFGYIDDAWLMHNTAWRLVEAGIIAMEAFPVNWEHIQMGDLLARTLLPPEALGQLENILMQYLNLIAAEIQAYQPQFIPGGGGYHPYMGGESTDDRWMDVMTDSLNYL